MTSFIIGVFVGWIVTAVCLAYKAQQGYIFHSEGGRTKWTHRQTLERWIWDFSDKKKG